jgi:hypothetical protein
VLHKRSYKLDLSRLVFFLTRFYHNRRKNDPQDLKNGVERRVPRFCTICDKNQPLNEKKRESHGNISAQMGLNF